MSEKHRVLITLTLVFETCKAGLTILATDPTGKYEPVRDSSNLSVLHTDFLSLLSLIYASTTKTSLVLKPSSPSYTAALEPLKELADRAAALPLCVRLIQIHHGKTLAAEAINTAKDLLEGVKSLMQTFITIQSKGSSGSSGEAGDEYMVKTGTVHEVINKARGQDGFSGNNLVAVRKVWKRNQDSLNDGVNEVHEILEDAETPEGHSGEEDDFDDGWGELGLPSGVKPSADELNKIKKIYAIVRLSALLHQRIFEHVLSPLSPPNSPSTNINTVLDQLAQASSDFLSLSDNFISTVYPPLVNEHTITELEHYRSQFALFQSKVDLLIPGKSIERLLEDLRLNNTQETTDDAKFQKWYTTCISQIQKNMDELEHELKV